MKVMFVCASKMKVVCTFLVLCHCEVLVEPYLLLSIILRSGITSVDELPQLNFLELSEPWIANRKPVLLVKVVIFVGLLCIL